MGRAFEYRKARKMKRWSHMAKVFTRIGKDIVIAVKAGGPDPEANSRLRALIQNAKAENMPKENVERAIKKATSKDQEDYKEIVYEGYGPYGIAIVVETATDNHNRTVANVRSYFTRAGGNLGTTGSLDFLFDKKSFFKIAKPTGMGLDDLELELIDFGAEEIFEDAENPEHLMIYADFKDFGALQKGLEEKSIEIVSSGFERIPTDTKQLSPEQQEEIEKLLEKFEEDEDVQNVYHNMA
ncbi:YebC/PmpR family DNA-binding transcriptional regulator [Cytophagales bacterium LB-30]|uniref:Probable transcriptional regulatory protein QWY31_09610 n=1 Tax=Shiella aurantiaca TaxID=3058365 RepID=A0ABT8F677_9BACT|nr:YebC/PmpR family DNA-binding transcriptional regulator [Shiella aurantiaca]MDN4165759.1 YebC/PmpR family DNA-binding transcriptional regulator [Shiella aurantiaca]